MKWIAGFLLLLGLRVDAQLVAGVARVKITPELPMWLSGYAGREKPATEVSQDLWAKALVLEDGGAAVGPGRVAAVGGGAADKGAGAGGHVAVGARRGGSDAAAGHGGSVAAVGPGRVAGGRAAAVRHGSAGAASAVGPARAGRGAKNRIVIVTTDLLGLSHEVSVDVARQVDSLYGIKRDQLLLNSSHTHSGPMVWPCVDIIFDFTLDQQRMVSQYSQQLTASLVKVIGMAMADRAPALLYSGRGSAGFAINRRNKIHPNGPVDHDVPVVKVVRPAGGASAGAGDGASGASGAGMKTADAGSAKTVAAGSAKTAAGSAKTLAAGDGSSKTVAILFGYACHNTTLVETNFLINGDYAGFAQADLEAENPGAVCMFLMGCGGDQNPDPRGTVELAKSHGRELADAVDTVLKSEKMKPVRTPIKTAYTTVNLPFHPFDVAEYEKEIVGDDKYLQRRARLMLSAYNRGFTPDHLVYPVQAVRFGKDLCVLALSGETVVDYSLKTKEQFIRENIIVAGYSGEVMCYIPSKRLLQEGGYEPEESMIYYGFPGPFENSVEDSVTRAISRVMKKVGAVEAVR